MTKTPGSGDRSGDGAVHSLLWRLRARLVTPPAEERVRSDLDRLLAAARDQAHLAPSDGASERPDITATPASPDSPLVRLPEPEPAAAAGDPVDELARRRSERALPATDPDAEPAAALAAATDRNSSTRARRRDREQAQGLRLVGVLTRVAAAGVAIVVVGTGVSAATDGQVSLLALLARDQVEVPQAAADADAPALAAPAGDDEVLDPAGPADLSADVGADGGGLALPDTDDQVPPDVDAGAEVEGLDDAADDTAPETDATGATEPAPSDAPRSGSTGSDSSGAGSSGGSTGSGSGGSSSGSGGSDADVPAEDTGSQVIAAPPPSQLDGFGGARCVDDRTDGCLIEEGGPVVDDGVADEEDGDDLASRRFQPDRATETERTATTQSTPSTSTATTSDD